MQGRGVSNRVFFGDIAGPHSKVYLGPSQISIIELFSQKDWQGTKYACFILNLYWQNLQYFSGNFSQFQELMFSNIVVCMFLEACIWILSIHRSSACEKKLANEYLQNFINHLMPGANKQPPILKLAACSCRFV